MAGFCAYMGTYPRRMNKWAQDEKLGATINRVKTDLFDRKLQMAETGEIRSNIFIFDAVNTLGAISGKTESKQDIHEKKTVEYSATKELLEAVKALK